MEKINETDKAIEILNKYQFIFDKGTEYCSLLDALENLKAYKATGLNAEDFNDLKVCLEDEGGVEGTISDLIELMHYRKLEERRLLIKLSCKVGDTIYHTSNFMGGILEEKIVEIIFDKWGYKIKLHNGRILSDDEFNKKWFLTQEEAENVLKKLNKLEVED